MSKIIINPTLKTFTGDFGFLYFYHNVEVDGKKIGVVKQNEQDAPYLDYPGCKKSWSFTLGARAPSRGFDSQDAEPKPKYYTTQEKAAEALLKFAISRANKKAKSQNELVY